MRISTLKQVALVLGPLLLLFYVGLFFLYCSNQQKTRTIIQERALNNVRVADQMLRRELRDVVADLQYLAGAHEAAAAVKGQMSRQDRHGVLLFMDRRQVYDQVRFLDITGMEVFRADYNAGRPAVARRRELQFKGNRYYVAAGLKLMFGDIYFSPLDLNVERGVIETPRKPMLRVVTPVNNDQDERVGLVVLNYFGHHLLDVFSSVPVPLDDTMMLLNEEGYWLKGPTPDDEWGFMFEDRKDRTFAARYPEAWKRICEEGEGQFLDKAGLMTFATLRLADAVPACRIKTCEHSAQQWKIVSLVGNEAYSRDSYRYAGNLALIGGPGTLFLAAISLGMVHFRRKSMSAEESVIRQNKSFARFVPTEFLRLIGKGNLQDVELGTSVQRQVGVLFSDIRSYTTLSESLGSHQVFDFLNDYFVFVSEPVTANRGFIDIFIGDALMALFPVSAEDALKAAIQMRLDLRVFNDARRSEGQPPVHSGYGLHWGEVTLGTIGSFERMQTTAIGDTVNLASRIESVTKSFKMEIVLSDSVYSRLREPEAYLLREVDTVRVKGKHEPVTLYECFDADPEPLARGKAGTRDLLAEAMVLYKAGSFEAALEKFRACAEACPEDSLPPIFIKRCNTLIRIPPGEDWAGVSTL